MFILTVKLSGTPLNQNFRGFLIQARTVGDNSSVGSFKNGSVCKQLCTNNVRMFVCTKMIIYILDMQSWVKHIFYCESIFVATQILVQLMQIFSAC